MGRSQARRAASRGGGRPGGGSGRSPARGGGPFGIDLQAASLRRHQLRAVGYVRGGPAAVRHEPRELRHGAGGLQPAAACEELGRLRLGDLLPCRGAGAAAQGERDHSPVPAALCHHARRRTGGCAGVYTLLPRGLTYLPSVDAARRSRAALRARVDPHMSLGVARMSHP
eukprot:1194651-Prorocentrum_minimum.AAC.6